MAFCRKCGAMIDDEAVICPECGVSQKDGAQSADNGGFGWGLLGFCIPIVGLVLYLVWKDTKPRTASAAGKGALIGVIVCVAFYAIGLFAGVSNSMMN